jgi:hypothetical protein
LSARDTVAAETPARLATSRIVTFFVAEALRLVALDFFREDDTSIGDPRDWFGQPYEKNAHSRNQGRCHKRLHKLPYSRDFPFEDKLLARTNSAIL